MTDIDEEARREIEAVPTMTAAGWRQWAGEGLVWAENYNDANLIKNAIHDARVALRAAEILGEGR